MLKFLITLGGISLGMSAVILLMLALQKPVKKRFTAIARYIIWSVIIIRLCLPVSLDILPKFITVESDMPEASVILPANEVYEPVIPEKEYIPEALPSAPSSEITYEPILNNTVNEVHTSTTAPTVDPVAPKSAFEITGEHILPALFAVWALGALTFIGITLVRYGINAKAIDKSLSLADTETLRIYDTVCRDLKLKKAPRLYMGRSNVSPMVYGFFNPKVILPSVEMSAETLTYILRHELTHYKRKDLYFKLLAMVANALHWFNPLAYIACGMMSAEAELSCDEKALSGSDLIARLGYGNSMLEIVKKCKHSPKLTTGFSPKKKAVKERFENMINTTKKKKGYWIVAITLILALLCTSIIGCATNDTESEGTDETTEPITEEYDAGGWLENLDGEDLRDWRLEVKDGVMTLEHTAEDGSTDLCYRYADSTKYDDVIDLDPILHITEENQYSYTLRGWISSNYALIQYDAPLEGIEDCENFYFATIDLKDGSVTNEIRYEVDDILKIHGLDRDVLSVYESWGGNAPEYRITDYVNRYEMAGEPPSNKMYISLTLENKDIRRAAIHLYFDMVTGELSEVEKGHCNLVKYHFNNVVTDIEDIDNFKDIDTGLTEAAVAFLTNDTAKLERLGGYAPNFFDDLKTLRFGDYRILNKDADKLEIQAYVTESQVFHLEKGFHTFTVNSSVAGATEAGTECNRISIIHECVECLCPELEYTSYAKTKNMASQWISFSDRPVVPLGDKYSDEYFNDVVKYIHNIYNANTVSEYRDYAKKCFGIDILNENYTDKEAEDIEAQLWDIYCENSPSHYIPRDLVDAGEGYVTYQFYADEGNFIPAYKVKYEFIEEGDYLYFKDCTVLDDTGRDISQLYATENEAEIIG